MRKTALLLALVLLGGSAAGVEYSTVVFDSDLKEHFRVEGWVQSASTNEIDVAVKYNTTLVHRFLNRSNVHYMQFHVMDGNTSLASASKGGFKLDSGGSKAGFLSVESPRSPDRIDSLEVRVNHTGVSPEGSKLAYLVNGSIQYKPTEKNPEIHGLQASKERMRRGENLTLTVLTTGIRNLTVNGSEMNYLGDDRFRTELPGASLVNGTNSLVFRTGRGSEFHEQLNVTLREKEEDVQENIEKEETGKKAENSSEGNRTKLDRILHDEDAKSFPGVLIDPVMKWLKGLL